MKQTEEFDLALTPPKQIEKYDTRNIKYMTFIFLLYAGFGENKLRLLSTRKVCEEKPFGVIGFLFKK